MSVTDGATTINTIELEVEVLVDLTARFAVLHVFLLVLS